MDADLEFSSGGVLATSADMAKFLAAIGGALLKRESWNALWTKPASVKEQTPYALGFGVTPFRGLRRAGHSGAAVGFASSLSYFPDQDAGVVVLTNGYQEPFDRNIQDLANEIALRAGIIAVD
jgi:CubicO group peptidase (beta-lactamase class C family)